MHYVFLAAYVAAILSVSIFSMKRTKSLDDFQLAGRRVGPYLSAFSYGTTYFSAVIFIGYAGRLGWQFGLFTALIGIGNAVFGSYLPWKVLGEKTRQITRQLGVSTMPGFLEARYQSRFLKVLSALVIFLFLTPYCASVYQGLSYLFESALGIPFFWCMLAMAAVTALYLVLGGYLANVLSNFVQGVLMILGVALMMFFLFQHMGGVGQAVTRLQAMEDLPPQNPWDLLWLIGMTSFGVWGLPQMVQKFYAIKDKEAVKTGTVVSTLFALFIGGCAYLAGAFGKVVLHGAVPLDASGAANFEMVVPQMLQAALPSMAISFILVLVLAASMSTLGSLIMVSASAIGVDFIKGVLRPRMKEGRVKLLLQLLCILFIAISFVIALGKNTSIITLMSFSWGTVAGFLIGPYVLGVLWKGTNRRGALAGGLSSLAVSLGLALWWGSAQSPLIACISMVVSLVATYLGSKMRSNVE